MFIPCYLAISLFLGAEVLDFDMTSQEKKQTGVYKLTSKEKLSLQKWIDAHYEKREEPLAQDVTEKHAVLSENLKNGKFIRLSDGTLWEIHPKDTLVAQGWITPVEIMVTQSGDAAYPYKLTNSLSGSSIMAKKADSTNEKSS